MKYISLVAHMQETGGEKCRLHPKIELALRLLKETTTSDEVRRKFFFILFYVCQKVFLME